MRAGGWGLNVGGHISGPWAGCRINLIALFFLSFVMVPKDVYLKNMRQKHLLKPMTLTLCLAMGSDRIVTKQGNSLAGLSLNWYIMAQIVYVSHFWPNWVLYFQIFLVRKFIDLKKTPKFFTFLHLNKYNKFVDSYVTLNIEACFDFTFHLLSRQYRKQYCNDKLRWPVWLK